ncbi:hypothetical protein GIS00_12710 [Nakamurella sp. YIM 132087]|uniref:Alpha/beta hydrolase n=1 Tax=Nakamurella alba TaxID=2665158 RepID=A0A7K1FKX8_9ACTN|nr:hypothetical protein [Nakamurella alba]MTD14802.1 hypothetical protein [Nakamurella alba]
MTAPQVIELRIHGVSGTPPDQLLDAPLVRQVAGDERTRFFRAVDPAGQELRGPDGEIVEAYHWGQLTSGSWKTAFWLLSVPFGLVNAAHFMLPAARSGMSRMLRVVAEAALRGLGILLTVTLTLAVAEAGIDQLAWQWIRSGTDPVCTTSGCARGWIIAAMVLTGALVPLLIWFGGGGSRRVRSSGAGSGPPVDDPLARTSRLAADEFAYGDNDTFRLQLLHAAASCGVVGVLGGALAGSGPLGTGSWIVLGAAVLLVAVTGNPLHRNRSRDLRLSVLSWLLLVAGVVAAVGAVITLARVSLPERPDPAGPGVFPGFRDLVLPLMALALMGMLVLLLATGLLAAATAGEAGAAPVRRYLAGMGAAVVAPVGVLLGVGFGAALVYGVNRVLGLGAGGPELPAVFVRTAHAWGLTALLVVVIGLVVIAVKLASGRRLRAEVAWAQQPAFFGTAKDPDDRRTAEASSIRGLATAWFLARLKYVVQAVLAVFAAAGIVLTTAGAAGTVAAPWRGEVVPGWAGWLEPVSRWIRSPAFSWLTAREPAPETPDPMAVLGTLVLLGVGLGLLYLGRAGLRAQGVRRGANVIWDVIAFWPRAAHPLVPPPYTARAIDTLRRRIHHHLGADPDTGAGLPDGDDVRLVLAAHSQGSLLTVAALTRLSPAVRKRLSLLTFGSQLQFAYSRAFPAYVNERVLREVLVGLRPLQPGGPVTEPEGWISLVRETDPIGGPVFSYGRSQGGTPTSLRWLGSAGAGAGAGGPEAARVADELRRDPPVRICGREVVLLDPVPVDPMLAPTAGPLGHGSYYRDPVWPAVVRYLSDRRLDADWPAYPPV